MEIRQSSLIAIGVVTAAMGLAYILSPKSRKLSKSPSTSEEEDDLEIINSQRLDLEKSRDLLKTLSSNLNIQFNQSKLLTKKSLLEFIIQGLQSVCEKQVIQLYHNNRKARRNYLTSIQSESSEKYFKYACYFDNEIEYIISKSHKDLAAFANIDEQIIQQSIDYHLQHDHTFINELMTVTVQLRRALKKKLKPTTMTTIQTTEKIIQRQINILQQDSQNIFQIIRNLGLSQQDQSFIPSFIHLYLCDLIQKEFGLEEEDYMNYEQELMVSESGRHLHRRLESAQNKFIQKIQSLQDLENSV